MQARLGGLLRDHPKAAQELEKAKRELANRREQLGGLISARDQTKAMLEALESEKPHCPVCESALDPARKKELRRKKLEDHSDQEKRLKLLEHEIKSLSSAIPLLEGAMAQSAELQKKSAELGEIASREPDLGRIVKALESEMTDRQKRVVGLKEKAEAAEEQFEAAREELFKLKDVMGAQHDLDRARAGLKKADLERNALQAKADAARRDYTPERLEAADASTTALEAAERYWAQRDQLAELERETAGAQAELGRSAFDEGTHETLQRQATEAESGLAALQATIRSASRLLDEKRRVRESVVSQLKRLEAIETEAAAAETKAQQLVLFLNCLVETQARLREEIVAEINAAAAAVWRDVYPYRDYGGLRLRTTEDDYVLELLRGSEWVAVEGFASGGERSTACLALRVAFAMVLVPNLSWLVLDEPTHNLDSEGVAALARALRESIPRIVDQVFVITHDEKLAEAASASMWRLERDKAAGGATRAISQVAS